MGIKTIAEFVESAEVLEHLKLLEVDFAQGLVIGGPQKLV
jgi:EAL domain-containing protein (putative c-di-GMP-specific phosphodiesterase class I)